MEACGCKTLARSAANATGTFFTQIDQVVKPTTRTLELVGKQPSTITLTEKYGVWFITDVSGHMRLGDFTSLNGWGETEAAVLRCAHRTNHTIREINQPTAPQTTNLSPSDKRSPNRKRTGVDVL